MVFHFKSKSKLKKKLNKVNVERELRLNGWNEYDLARQYITGFQRFNYPMKSDLRPDDVNKSMFTRIQNGNLIISDFGYRKGMNIYDYLLEKYYNGIQNEFYSVLNMIRNDFKLNNIERLNNKKSNYNPIKYNKIVKDTSLPVKIEVKRQRDSNGDIEWSKKDISYWKSFGISTKKLEEKSIAPLEMFWITNNNKDGIRRSFNMKRELCYVYPFFRNEAGLFMYKLYMPLGVSGNPNFKWLSNVNRTVVHNLKHIPTSGDLLIIQSSYKDVMCLEQVNSDLNIIAPNAEGIWFDDKLWAKLRSNWKHIVLFANNDFDKNPNPGLMFARKYSEKYKIPFVCTPDNTTSDISDYYKLFGKSKTIEFSNNVLDNIKLLT